jgi:CDP-diacylglycerol--serine O-phosphatidyltransferase
MKFPHPMRRKDDRPDRRLRRGMYILPSMFTAANIAAGYFALVQITQGSPTAPQHFNSASIAIGFAVLFDSLDGAIARMTNTSSDFGRELDSLADVITFGVAPAMLAFFWGFHFLPDLPTITLPFLTVPLLRSRLVEIGMVLSFLFLMAGASRLARFNIQVNPEPSNPGRPGKKYFVGMPIPAGAGVIAAVVHFSSGDPIASWWTALTWMLMVVAVGYLMVSTWRFYSFKDLDFRSRQPFRGRKRRREVDDSPNMTFVRVLSTDTARPPVWSRYRLRILPEGSADECGNRIRASDPRGERTDRFPQPLPSPFPILSEPAPAPSHPTLSPRARNE